MQKTITLQVMTEDKNRMIAVDGGSNYRYPSIDAQSAEITITKVQLGYMRMPDSEDSDTEAVLVPGVGIFMEPGLPKNQSMSTEMGRMDWSWET